MAHEIAAERPEELHKPRHPEGLHNDEEGKECHFAHQIGERAYSSEFFLLENLALPGDFTGRIIRAHQGEEDDLEHDHSRDR